MANSDKNIIITPNTNQTSLPNIRFVGSSSNPISLDVLDDNTISFSGSQGQLFSINHNLSTGTIFSVNDISGIPSIEVDANGTISLAEFGGNVGIGTASPAYKLTVLGTVSASQYLGPGIGGGGSSTPGGPNTSVQFNSGSSLSGSGNLVFDYTTNILSGTTARFTTITGSTTTGSLATFTTVSGTTVVPDKINFNISAPIPAQQEGVVHYDGTTNQLLYWTDVQDVQIALGQELAVRCQNDSGDTINKGQVVYIKSSSLPSDTPRITTASFSNEAQSARTLGVVMTTVAQGDRTYVLLEGVLTGVDTTNYSSGQSLYLSSSGNLTNVKPVAPYHDVRVAQVIRPQTNNGSIFVKVQNGYELDEIHDVLITGKQNGDLLVYNSDTSLWNNSKNLSGSYALTGNLTITDSVLVYGSASLNSNPTAAYIIYSSSLDKIVAYPGLYVSGSSTISGNLNITGQLTASSFQVNNLNARLQSLRTFGRTVTANYILTDSDHVILVSGTTANIELTLPSAAANPYIQYVVKKIDPTIYKAVVYGSGSEKIDGVSPLEINTQYESVTLFSDGVSSWHIL